MSTCPRQILPDQTVMITIRAVGRSFRFVPVREVVQLLLFCLFSSAEKYGVAVHEYVWLSNHCHILLTDKRGVLPDFVRDMDSLISRNLNAMRGWKGTNFEKGYNMVVETDCRAILGHAAYILANPCAADLVKRAGDWKGVTSWTREYGKEFVIRRPEVGMWKKKDAGKKKRKPDVHKGGKNCEQVIPDKVVAKLVRPPALLGELSDKELRDKVRGEVAKLENEAQGKRSALGRKVLGWVRVVAQKWWDIPRKREDLFGPVPRAAGSCKWKRVEAARRSLAFLQAYRKALAKFVDETFEEPVVFPCGTWLMRVRYNVKCGTSPP